MATSGQGDAGWRVPSQSMTRFICCRQAARALERLEDPIVFLRVSSFVRVGGPLRSHHLPRGFRLSASLNP